MANNVACRLCGEKLNYEQLFQLGVHLLDNHPTIEIIHYLFDDDEGDGIRWAEEFLFNKETPSQGAISEPKLSQKVSQKLQKSVSIKKIKEKCSTKSLCSRKVLNEKYSLKKIKEKINTKKRQWIRSEAYRTCVSVENWRRGQTVMRCKKCGKSETPLIRHRKNKVTNNPIGAFFLLTFWPIYFLPILMFGKTEILVCCSRCGYCIGNYDVHTGKIVELPKETVLEVPNICS